MRIGYILYYYSGCTFFVWTLYDPTTVIPQEFAYTPSESFVEDF
jgi:hypothetical protein